MRIVFLTSRYPSSNDIYAHMFVHFRAKEFVNRGYDVHVYVPSNETQKYLFEGVAVTRTTSSKIIDEISEDDVFYIHLLNIYPSVSTSGWHIYQYIMKNELTAYLYMHGSEVQTSRVRKNFKEKLLFVDYLKEFYKDYIFIPRIRKFASYVNNNFALITPSKWMHHEAETELAVSLPNTHIIPNGIDIDLFKFSPNYRKHRKLITIRPLSSDKYAVDLAIKLMTYLPVDFTLDIYGRGDKKTFYTSMIHSLGLSDRVKIIDDFISREQLPEVLNRYGAFVATTRMDAQGVMMCEAMASGRIILTSDNTAIPEFVENNVNGLCNHNLETMAKDYLNLVADEKKFTVIANSARESMCKISLDKMSQLELNILNGK